MERFFIRDAAVKQRGERLVNFKTAFDQVLIKTN